MLDVREDKSWKGDTETQQPDTDAQDDAWPQGAVTNHFVCMHDGYVAVQGHGYHEEDAAEEAYVVAASQETAHETSKDPLTIGGEVGKERQSEDEDQVRQSQVQQADVCQVGLMPVFQQHTHHQAVT